MPSLKDLKTRISTVKSTQKITKAMKMVAMAKLRRSQDAVTQARPYSEALSKMTRTVYVSKLNKSNESGIAETASLSGNYLLVVFSSDRGLCGALNSNIFKKLRERINELESSGKQVSLLLVGRKIQTLAKRPYEHKIVGNLELSPKQLTAVEVANHIFQTVEQLKMTRGFDNCEIIYPNCKSILVQLPVKEQVIPYELDHSVTDSESLTEFEPSLTELFDSLSQQYVKNKFQLALLETQASEHAARVAAMDGATRNAEDSVKRLTVSYNTQRQANITKELIEIISGAEAL